MLVALPVALGGRLRRRPWRWEAGRRTTDVGPGQHRRRPSTPSAAERRAPGLADREACLHTSIYYHQPADIINSKTETPSHAHSHGY